MIVLKKNNMAKKTSTPKTYRAKVNLPGGCIKDTLICNGKYLNTGKPCLYDCENEKGFFEEVLPPKYPTNTTVIMKEQLLCRLCDLSGETKGLSSFTLPAYTEFTIKGEKKKNTVLYLIVEFNKGFYYLVPEKSTYPAEVYFYLSSKGIIHHSYVGRDLKSDKFRKSVGNFHKTKPEADKFKISLVKYWNP